MVLESIPSNAMIAVTPDQVSTELQGELVIFDFNTGMYYGLNAVGSRVWRLLSEPRTVHEIRDQILDQYEVEPEQCERDLLDLLTQLAAEGLIEIRSGPERSPSLPHDSQTPV